MIQISLCMIVKNEEDVLARCLDSIKDLVDEIILVDTGSNDRTKEIARTYTGEVYDFPWVDDFAAARNHSFSKASMPYRMWLDADDLILEPDRQKLARLKQTLTSDVDVVMLPYHTAFDEDGNPSFSYYRERILRNSPAFLWAGAVHEAISPSGRIVYGDAAVTHRKLRPGDPDRNMRIFEKLLADGTGLSPREQFYYARELSYHHRFGDAVPVLEAFLNERKGWIENSIEACRCLSDCYRGLGDESAALRALLASLEFDAPRAEICCDIGKWFMDKCEYQKAIFWYETALGRVRDDTSGAFVIPDCYGYIPCIQLCVCWYHLGNPEKAAHYNERAGSLKPDDKAYLYNRKFFQDTGETVPPASCAPQEKTDT